MEDIQARPLPFHISLSVLIHGVVLGTMMALLVIQAWSPQKPHEQPIDVTFVNPARPLPPQKKIVTRPRRLDIAAPKDRTQVVVHEDIKPATTTQQQEAPTSTATANPSLLSVYVGSILQLIENQKHYPPSAQRRGQQGRVVLSLKLSRGGDILAVTVLEPSPYTDLNDASLETIQRIGHFPPLPDGIKLSEVNLKVPVEYKLQ